MKVVKWIIGVVAVLFVVFLLVTAFLPTEYSMERRVTIEARPGVIYNQLVDLEAWQEWNPWNEVEPALEVSYGDETIGEGAYYEWSGEASGNGRMEIVETQPPFLVRYRLVFDGYEDNPSRSAFRLDPQSDGSGTEVIWSFSGSVGDSFFARWLSVLIDSLVGASYEQGLEALKDRCEELESSGEAQDWDAGGQS